MKFDKLFGKVYQLELYANWSLGHTNVPLQALQTYLLLVAVFRKPIISFFIVLAGVTALLITGYWGVERRGLLKTQNSINNTHNVELLKAAGLEKYKRNTTHKQYRTQKMFKKNEKQ